MKTLAFLIGVLAAGAALADDFHPPTPADFYMTGALGVLLVGLTVRVLRQVFADALAPAAPTRTSKNLTLLASLVSGALWGLAGVGVQIAPGLHGWILGGLAIGALAYTGAGAIGAKARGETPSSAP